MTTLGPQFWNKLLKISQSLGMNPKDLLAVMYYESGLNPAAHNKDGNASGLIQFMPDTLKGLGFSGSHSDFRETDSETQLDYVEKYVRNQMKFNGGPFKSATQYYVANLWPVALRSPGVVNQDPKTPIIERNPKVQKYPGVSLEKERMAYKSNSGLDVDQDGIISYGDLDKVMNGVKSSSGYRFALNQLESGKEIGVGKKSPTDSAPSNKAPTVDESYLAQVNKLLDTYLSAVAVSERQSNLYKKSLFKKHLTKNNMVIEVKSNDFINSIEFARILCLALEEEVQADTEIDTDNKNIEIQCEVYGPHNLCIKAVSQLANSLSDAFKAATQSIGGVKIITNVIPNKISNYQKLDIKVAQAAYRKFHYKFINRT